MGGTVAISGALFGAAICLIAGAVGTSAVLAAAVSDEQRQVLKELLACGAAYAAAVMGLILLAAFGILASWAYAAAALLWFGPLVPALAWMHRRLDAAAGDPRLHTAPYRA